MRGEGGLSSRRRNRAWSGSARRPRTRGAVRLPADPGRARARELRTSGAARPLATRSAKSPTLVLRGGVYHVRSGAAACCRRALVVAGPTAGCGRSATSWTPSSTRVGPQVVLDRLLDWLLVCTLRDWFDQPEAVRRPGWYRDERRHGRPGAARDARRAGQAVDPRHPGRARPGCPVTRWPTGSRVGGRTAADLPDRLADDPGRRPADRLHGDGRRGGASPVGYADAFGFSAAFKRVHGVSPSEYRRTCRTDAACVGSECSPV